MVRHVQNTRHAEACPYLLYARSFHTVVGEYSHFLLPRRHSGNGGGDLLDFQAKTERRVGRLGSGVWLHSRYARYKVQEKSNVPRLHMQSANRLHLLDGDDAADNVSHRSRNDQQRRSSRHHLLHLHVLTLLQHWLQCPEIGRAHV